MIPFCSDFFLSFVTTKLATRECRVNTAMLSWRAFPVPKNIFLNAQGIFFFLSLVLAIACKKYFSYNFTTHDTQFMRGCSPVEVRHRALVELNLSL
jgi:hypothetical protein